MELIKRKHHKEKFSTYFDLRDACAQNRCPVCRLLDRGTERSMENLLYENVNDGGIRARLRKSLGFCKEHALFLIKIGDTLGIAIIYQDILRSILKSYTGEPSFGLPTAQCPVCELRSKNERGLIDTLVEYLDDSEMKSALEKSEGVCLPHLYHLWQACKDSSKREWITDLHAQILRKLRARLSSYVRKQDVQFQNERVTDAEQTSCEEAISFLTGTNA